MISARTKTTMRLGVRHVPERERGSDRVEGGGGDGEPDHAGDMYMIAASSAVRRLTRRGHLTRRLPAASSSELATGVADPLRTKVPVAARRLELSLRPVEIEAQRGR
jgi:hypothetical protein